MRTTVTLARLAGHIAIGAVLTLAAVGCTTSQLPESRAGASAKIAASSPTLGVGY